MKLHLGELRRRGIFKTLAAYAVASWVSIEVVSIVAPAFLLPNWTMAAVTTVLVLGAFPALIFAWRYDFTNRGIERDSADVPDEVDRVARLLGLIFVVGLLAITATLWLNYLRAQSDSAVEAMSMAQEGAPRISDDGRIRSIAVLPFDDFSPGDGRRFLADGIAESILHVLAQEKNLLVIARKSSFYFRDKDVTVAEIGRILNVQAVVEGSVRIVDDQLRVTTQLIRTSDQAHIWSNEYQSPLTDLFVVQDTIAQTVRDLVMDGESAAVTLADDTHYPSLEAYELLMEARALLEARDLLDFDNQTDRPIRLLRLAIEISSDYADAHAWLAFALQRSIDFNYDTVISDGSRFDYLVNTASEELEQALNLDPSNALAMLIQIERWPMIDTDSEREEKIQKMLELAPNDPFILTRVGQLVQYGLYGDRIYSAKYRDLIDRARAVDPSHLSTFRAYMHSLCGLKPLVQEVEAQLKTYPEPTERALELRYLANMCDGRSAEAITTGIQLAKLNGDANTALGLLMDLARLGHAEAIKQINVAHRLMPTAFAVMAEDQTIFFTDALENRRKLYRWQASNEMLYRFPQRANAVVEVQSGNLRIAEQIYSRSLDRKYSAGSEVRVFAKNDFSDYSHLAWLMRELGEVEDGAALAQELLRIVDHSKLTEWSDTAGQQGHLPLMVFVLNDKQERALNWLRDAERAGWLGFQAVLTSPIYADFRKVREVTKILARMRMWRAKKLDEVKATGLPEVLDPSLIVKMIKDSLRPSTNSQLGEIAMHLEHDLEQAARHYERALDMELGDPAPLSEKYILRAQLRSDKNLRQQDEVVEFLGNIFAVYGAVEVALRLGRSDLAVKLNEYAVEHVYEVGSGRTPASLGRSYYYAGRWDAAIAQFQEIIEKNQNPDSFRVRGFLGLALVLKGEPEKALQTIREERDRSLRLMGLAIAYHALGRTLNSDKTLEQLIDQFEFTERAKIARVLAYRGEFNRAFAWLNKLEKSIADTPPEILIDPLIANLHDDPRWLAFLRERGQAPEQLMEIEFNVTLPK